MIQFVIPLQALRLDNQVFKHKKQNYFLFQICFQELIAKQAPEIQGKNRNHVSLKNLWVKMKLKYCQWVTALAQKDHWIEADLEMKLVTRRFWRKQEIEHLGEEVDLQAQAWKALTSQAVFPEEEPDLYQDQTSESEVEANQEQAIKVEQKVVELKKAAMVVKRAMWK